MIEVITPELKIGAVNLSIDTPILIKRIKILPLIQICIPLYRQTILIVNKWINLAPKMQIGACFENVIFNFIGVKGIALF